MKRPLFVCAAAVLLMSSTTVRRIPQYSATAAFSCSGFPNICVDFSGTLATDFIHIADCTGDEAPNTCCNTGTGVGRCSTGTFSITSGELYGAPTDPNGSGDAAALRATTDAGGATQYACTKFVTYPGVSTTLGQMGIMLRQDDDDTAGGNPLRAYGIVVSGADNIAYWSTYSWSTVPSVDAWVWGNDNASQSMTFAAGDYMCARVTGTGTATVLDVWKYTTAPTMPPIKNADCTGSTTPVACCTGSGTGTCTAPTWTSTADPGAVADSGRGVGFIYEGFSSGKHFDNFVGGGS